MIGSIKAKKNFFYQMFIYKIKENQTTTVQCLTLLVTSQLTITIQNKSPHGYVNKSIL